MSAGNLSGRLFGEKFRKIQTPRTGRNILSQMPFSNNHQLCFRKPSLSGKFSPHTFLDLGQLFCQFSTVSTTLIDCK